MRKIPFYILSSLLVLFTACEYNEEHFPELDELTRPVDLKMFDYELTEADYAAIAGYAANKSLAAADGVASELENLKTTQQFSSSLPASKYVPAFMAANWATADNNSAVKLTYNWVDVRPEYLSELASADIYKVSNADYEEVWYGEAIHYFTPSKPLSRNANSILKAAFPESEEGDLKVVGYNYSDTEPADYVDPVVTSVNEDFSNAVVNQPVDLNGWINFAEVGSRKWEGKSFSGNFYTQITAHGSGEEIVAWLISPEINLADALSPMFSFDVKLGYYNADVMQILISEDFRSGNPSEASWKDVTHHFSWYGLPGGYTDMYVAGLMDLAGYKQNTFRVAFRYTGDASDANNLKTTTYQIDNVQIGAETTVVSESLSDFADAFSVGLGNWTLASVQGGNNWAEGTFNQQKYMGNTAFGKVGEQEGWLVSPSVTIPAGVTSHLLVDLVERFHNSDCLSVLVSEDYVDDVTTATWVDVSDEFKRPVYTGTTSPTSAYGAASLNSFKGKDVHIAFKYVGNADNSRTTTYQIYDVSIASYTRSVPETVAGLKSVSAVDANNYAIYTLSSGAWQPYNEAVILNGSDYTEMGFSFFSSTNKPEDYLPNYLKKSFPYALDGAVKTVVYLYGNGSTLAADEYVFESGVWTKNLMTEVVTDQFVKKSGNWFWDPSMVINLAPVRNDPFIMTYYQAAADWIWEHIDKAELGATNKGEGYVSSYGNNEYYAGTSAYYNNIDMRAQAARNQYPAGYEGKSDAEVVAMMMERLGVVMGEVLSILHADVRPIEGVEITFTLNVAIYMGTTVSDVTHTLVYNVVGPGEFELVSGPEPIAN